MALTVTKIDSTDPQYDPTVDKFTVAGAPTVPNSGFTFPTVLTLAQAQSFATMMQAQTDAAVARLAPQLAAANEMLAAVQAASATPTT